MNKFLTFPRFSFVGLVAYVIAATLATRFYIPWYFEMSLFLVAQVVDNLARKWGGYVEDLRAKALKEWNK